MLARAEASAVLPAAARAARPAAQTCSVRSMAGPRRGRGADRRSAESLGLTAYPHEVLFSLTRYKQHLRGALLRDAGAMPAALADAVDRRIIDALQGDFPVCERPYAAAAEASGIEEELLARLQSLPSKVLTRFRPMFQIEQAWRRLRAHFPAGGARCRLGPRQCRGQRLFRSRAQLPSRERSEDRR